MTYPKPILLTGCTSSGKSKLAKELALLRPSLIINADALQVYDCWNLITARPTYVDMSEFEHALYGHISYNTKYAVSAWLNELKQQLIYAEKMQLRPIIVGGTGLYFTLLTEGISEIPPISIETSETSSKLLKSQPQKLLSDLEKFDPQTYNSIDKTNFSRIQRAWEVLIQTGRGIRYWQETVSPPILPIDDVVPIILSCSNTDLNIRIKIRLKKMIEHGVIEEVRKVTEKAGGASKNMTAFRAIGVEEIRQFIENKIDMTTLEQSILIKTRQYAKKQRTWFRNKFVNWRIVSFGRQENFKYLAQHIEKN